MELKIKNEMLMGHFEAMEAEARRVMDIDPKDEQERERRKAWIGAHPEHILYGFLNSFLDCCEMHKLEFDLTYETVKNISSGLAMLYSIQKNT